VIETPDYARMLEAAITEARRGLAEGGIPIGAALFRADGVLLGSGHNRRVQEDDPSVQGDNATIATPSWSPRSRPAGTAAAW
jgi:cytosine deaminase